jgi:hypothetical protein
MKNGEAVQMAGGIETMAFYLNFFWPITFTNTK